MGWEFILDAFWSISQFRPRGINGPDPLQPSLIRDWLQLMGHALDIEDIKIILAADAAYIRAEAEEAAYRQAVAQEEARAQTMQRVRRR